MVSFKSEIYIIFNMINSIREKLDRDNFIALKNY